MKAYQKKEDAYRNIFLERPVRNNIVFIEYSVFKKLSIN